MRVIQRWTPKTKLKFLKAINEGTISKHEVMKTYNFTLEELDQWQTQPYQTRRGAK